MSSVYGSPLFIGGSQQISDLPPLLSNFRASIDESQTGQVILSADKMEESRAKDLAGAVWVYGDHAPKNANDGTKIELTRDEVIKPDFIPPITLADVPVSDADTETVVNLKESDGKLHPYLYLSNNHNGTVGGLLLRKNIGTVKGVWCSWENNPTSDTYRYWCENDFLKNTLDASVSSQVINGNIKANFRNTDSYKTELGSVKCFALSLHEYGLKLGDSYIKDEGPHLSYFSNDSRRIAYNDAGGAIEHYTRTTITASGHMVNTSGQVGYESIPHNVPHGLRPAIFLPLTFKLKPTPNPDGSYDMYEESSAQTLATGKTIADLPSKSKVKLGKFSGIPLKWLVCRDSVDQSLRLILDGESVGVIGNKMADNHAPNNPDSSRRNYGNNRYIWSNIRQWLNSDKPANQWYTAQHTYDAAPDYINVAGFLHEWTEKEISVLENASWVVTKHSVDGGGSESFQNKVALPSTTEMGLESNTGGARIDIFNNNEDRVVSGVPYWCRTPYSSNAYDACTIHTGGTLHHYRTDNTGYGVRPLCKPVASTLVSNEPDSDGCYTVVFTPPLERTVAWDKSKNFYARQFTYNSKKQYQTMLEGATAELLLGEVPLPVSNLTISENAGASPTLSWKNPTDKNYHETVVVQKEGSTPPRSTDDGIEVYRGNDESVTVKDLQSTVDYSFGVFTLSQYGNYGEPVTISYRYDFPSEPTGYTKLSEISESTTWKLPENGYFLICAIGKSGDGGKGVSIDAVGNATGIKSCSIAGGGSGGTGSFSERLISGHKGDEYILTITNAETKVERLGKTIIHARAGGNGSDARADSRRDVYQGIGGAPGTSLQVDGSQIQNGESGQAGEKWQYDGSDPDNPWRVQGGRSVTRTYNSSVAIAESCSTSSGQGGNGDPIYQEGTYYTPGGTGTHGQIIIYRGNTNTPSPQ